MRQVAPSQRAKAAERRLPARAVTAWVPCSADHRTGRHPVTIVLTADDLLLSIRAACPDRGSFADEVRELGGACCAEEVRRVRTFYEETDSWGRHTGRWDKGHAVLREREFTMRSYACRVRGDRHAVADPMVERYPQRHASMLTTAARAVSGISTIEVAVAVPSPGCRRVTHRGYLLADRDAGGRWVVNEEAFRQAAGSTRGTDMPSGYTRCEVCQLELASSGGAKLHLRGRQHADAFAARAYRVVAWLRTRDLRGARPVFHPEISDGRLP